MSSRPRVVVVGPLPPPVNGMTRMTEVVLRSGLAERFELLHVDTADHRPQSSMGKIDVRNVWLGLRHGAAFLRALMRRPDACYIPIARSRVAFLRDLVFLVPARIARRPVVLHFHSRDFVSFYADEPWLMRRLIRFALGGDTHAVVLGESRRGDFGTLIPLERVHVVPNGVPDVGAGGADRGPVVLHLASLRREKGVFTVLEVARALRDVPGLRVILAGEWRRESEHREAMEYVQTEGLAEIVEDYGTAVGADKCRLLREAAVMLFPSTYAYEGHPLVVLEALSAGTPVVAPPLAAIPEMLQDGECGYLVEADDVAGMRDRVRSLLTDQALRSELGAVARRRYEERFTDARFAETLGSVWEAALTSGPRRPVSLIPVASEDSSA